MKALFKVLALGCLLLAVPSLAIAGNWNIQQKDTGTVWNDGDSNTVPVGDTGLAVLITNISEASTHFVVSHKKGRIAKVYATLKSAISGTDPTIGLFIAGATSTTQFLQVSAPAIVTLDTTNSAAGSSFNGTPASDQSPASGGATVTDQVEAGGVIAVRTDGGSTGVAEAVVIIIVE